MAKTKNKRTKAQIARDHARKFNREVKKALYTAFLAAFGFLIALVWRDVIQSWVEKISATSPVQGMLVSALIVTIICVIGILVVTKFLKVNE
jgi:uncharacterized membrane protein